MSNFQNFKNNLIHYLQEIKELEQRAIDIHAMLSDEERVDEGYMILGAQVVEKKGKQCFLLSTPVNNTKWRQGDMIAYVDTTHKFSGECRVIENCVDSILVDGITADANNVKTFNLWIRESELVSLFLSVMEKIKPSDDGAFFVEELFDSGLCKLQGRKPIAPTSVNIPKHLNEEQKKAVFDVLKGPSVYAIQGPPGTGKTDVLANLAKIYSDMGMEVLVLSNTHQAVNNALNKVASFDCKSVVKVGDEFKAQGLNPSITNCYGINNYKMYRKRNRSARNDYGDIVGMTLCGAIINLYLHGSAFCPSIILVDEASQIPLAMAACIGVFGASHHIFIGDDRQMPPIFHEGIKDHELSISVFEHLNKTLPSTHKTVLTTSYRMNKVICRYVSENFYEPYGITLKSHELASDRHITDESLTDSVQFIDIISNSCEDENEEEAVIAVVTAQKYLNNGYEVAVITPYRKQVNMIRRKWIEAGGTGNEILIDTVERLQGQDVDVIILSIATSQESFFKNVNSFLLNPNRLNVMFSRAKKKVVVLKSPVIDLKSLRSSTAHI